MRVIVTGAKGQLGYDVERQLTSRGIDAVGIDKDELDITDAAAVEAFFAGANADAVIHCAAYTAVDAAEDDAEAAMLVNVKGTKHIAIACEKLDMKMIYISTDYVFDGTGDRPWEPWDECGPVSVYGRTKYEGELAVRKYLTKYYIVRISWVFGTNGKNFVTTMLRLGREGKGVNVVDDQFGSPTYTKDLSVLLADMVVRERYGTYHATNEGTCSWYEFAQAIFKMAGMDVAIHPVDSDSYVTKAKRPKNSRMSKDKLVREGFARLRNWEEALKDYIGTL